MQIEAVVDAMKWLRNALVNYDELSDDCGTDERSAVSDAVAEAAKALLEELSR